MPTTRTDGLIVLAASATPPASPPPDPSEPDKIDTESGKPAKDNVKAREEASVFARQPDDPGPLDEKPKKPEKTWL